MPKAQARAQASLRAGGKGETLGLDPATSLLAREGVQERLLAYQAACPEDYALEYLPSPSLQHTAPHLLQAVWALTKHNMAPFHPGPGEAMAWADGDKWRDLTTLRRAHYFLLLSRTVCVESLAGVLYVQETTELEEGEEEGEEEEEEEEGDAASSGTTDDVGDDSGSEASSTDAHEDEDTNDPVLYCYDLQIHPDHQSQGLGKYLMSIYLDLAEALGRRPMLTVFKRNVRALEFYSAFG
jgi:GNAT superfamily N-acetyltransferase